ncbi:MULTISPECIES: hypothetical protein [Mesorhizobium]|uniref:hypothetical protein n=1 Tax=Mesorhizobium TaxID=68287 RepID=UPI0007ECFAFF|nr:MULTISPECIES: hypothetical protein [Mesorhizobium]TPJ43680.1 hypothetical protein FJ437_20125 [Mesorhizobium sp. B2-6-6]ARP67308.1 hypothetical protein A9K65_031310 [Mesorhizobium sp. WSM1497]MCA0002968.1 hypothetical protein [Mesorhizobium sp. B264B2A]MCA0009254.1 hypothetical protein [Mesorhizobium sp. B264B1B]MCA0013945.1 hypothetical protein [Mesorhizobium sp. B294B1A1]
MSRKRPAKSARRFLMPSVVDDSFKTRNRALPGNIDDRMTAAMPLAAALLRALASGFAIAALHSLW